MSGIAILLLIVVAIWVLWPVVSRWLQRKASEKTEDFIRNAMGMPPRPGSRKAKQEERKRQNQAHYEDSDPFESFFGRRCRNTSRAGKTFMPKEYAEDVEYVETKEYSSDRISESSINTSSSSRSKSSGRAIVENQVSDAEWTDL